MRSPRNARRSGAATWAAGAAAGITAAILAFPFALEPLVPSAPTGRIGVYERVALRGDGVTAGFIAPEGWRWIGSRHTGEFLSAERSASISVELHPNTDDVRDLLGSGLPIGALAEPVLPLSAAALPARPAQSGLAIHTLEYDLSAGDSPILRAAVCTDAAWRDCVLVTGAFSDFADYRADDGDADPARLALLRLLSSVEIVR